MMVSEWGFTIHVATLVMGFPFRYISLYCAHLYLEQRGICLSVRGVDQSYTSSFMSNCIMEPDLGLLNFSMDFLLAVLENSKLISHNLYPNKNTSNRL